jgi:hypothetical protein
MPGAEEAQSVTAVSADERPGIRSSSFLNPLEWPDRRRIDAARRRAEKKRVSEPGVARTAPLLGRWHYGRSAV